MASLQVLLDIVMLCIVRYCCVIRTEVFKHVMARYVWFKFVMTGIVLCTVSLYYPPETAV